MTATWLRTHLPGPQESPRATGVITPDGESPCAEAVRFNAGEEPLSSFQALITSAQLFSPACCGSMQRGATKCSLNSFPGRAASRNQWGTDKSNLCCTSMTDSCPSQFHSRNPSGVDVERGGNFLRAYGNRRFGSNLESRE